MYCEADMTNLTLWVLLPPLVGFIILGVIGRLLPRGGILAIGWGACGLAFLFAVFDFFSVLGAPASGRTNDLVIYNWITSGTFRVDFGLLLVFFFFNDTATTEIYTLSLHDALPI